MIKLIITDMDGTLLNSQKKLSPNFEHVYSKLKQQGIIFAVASGRPHYTLLKQFNHFNHDIILIGDNGGYIGVKPSPIIMKSFVINDVIKISEVGRETNQVYIVICTPNFSYTLSSDPIFLNEAQKYYPDIKVINCLEEICDDVIKIAIYDQKTWQLNSSKVWETFINDFVVAKSSDFWIDIMPQGINKGSALRYIQNLYNIKHEETMAFGDFHNDIEMLQMSYFSYAMQNAHADVKKVAKFNAPSNDNNGVLEVIEQYILNKN